jgi:hypothetical protein
MYENDWGVEGVVSSSRTGRGGEMQMSASYTPSVDTYEERDYEQRSYSASVRTMRHEKVCEDAYAFADSRDVMLRFSRTDRHGCKYVYAVTRAHAPEFLDRIRELSPYSIVRVTDSGRKQVLRYTGERDILLQKQAMLESLLAETERAYTDVLAQARGAGDVATMNEAIDGKLSHLETLSDKRIRLAQELARLNRNLADTEEQIAFVTVSLQVEGVQIIDGADIAGDWLAAWRTVVETVMGVLIGITLGLIGYIAVVFQYALYAFVLIVAVRYGWLLLRKTVFRSKTHTASRDSEQM